MDPAPHDRFWNWFERHAARLHADMYGPDERLRAKAAAALRDASEEIIEPYLLQLRLEMGAANA